MAERDSWAVQAAGPTGLLDVEDARVALGALWTPSAAAVGARSGFRATSTNPGSVTATGTPDAFVHVTPFQLVLQTGRAAVGGPYIMTLDAIKDINVLSTPAHATNPRDDLIVAQQSDTFYGDGVSTWTVRQVVGTPAGSPSDPAVSGSGDYVALARVRVAANATTITGANITDLRTSGHAKSLTGGLFTVAAGGILPVASQAHRDALSPYDGLTVWRQDRDWVEVYDGTAWRVQGVANVANAADLSAVTNPATGQLAWLRDIRAVYDYSGSAWRLVTRPYVYLVRASAAINVVSGAAEVPIPWDSPGINTYGMWASGNPTRLLMPWTGAYRINPTLNWTVNAAGQRDLWVRRNGAARIYDQVVAGVSIGNSQGHGFVWTSDFTAADYVELMPYQNSGSTLNLAVVPASVLVEYIGA